MTGVDPVSRQIDTLEDKISSMPAPTEPSPEADMNVMRKAVAKNDLAKLKTAARGSHDATVRNEWAVHLWYAAWLPGSIDILLEIAMSVRTRPKFHFILGTLNIAAQLGNLADNAARLVIENARQIPIGHAIAEIATIHRAHNQAGTASPNGPPQAGGLTRLSVAAHRPGKASNQTFRVLLVNGAALLRKGNRTAPSWRIAAASGKRKPRRL
jgi:hypothetical protein